MNGGENGVTQNGGRYGASNGHQDLHDEDRPESVQSNDSMCSGSFPYNLYDISTERRISRTLTAYPFYH